MTIDTREEASTLWRTKSFVVIIYTVALVVMAAFIPIDTEIKWLVLGGLSLILLALYWYQYKMEYTYFYFSNNNKNLVFKFYSMRNLHGKAKSIEIAKTNFVKYDIETSFMNRKESLILYQKTPKGVAKYPSISLTLLSKNQKTDLKRALFAASNH